MDPHEITQRICFERKAPEGWNPPDVTFGRNINFDASSQTRLAFARRKTWPSGCQLRCAFLRGTHRQKTQVEKIVAEWEQYANISFLFVEGNHGDIRIDFSPGGSWSAVGTDAVCTEVFKLDNPTVNFGWLFDDTSEQEWRRVVLHEFGHVLGCVHEHQSPNANLKWNKEAILEAYKGPPNYWPEAKTQRNILDRADVQDVDASGFDEHSIMLYRFDGESFFDGIGTPQNNELSQLDKEFIAKLYPK